MNVSKNFSLSEFEYSYSALSNKIDNSVPSNLIPNIKDLAVNVLQPLRDRLQHPIRITSGYRCPKLNRLVNGSLNSQHMTGQAADIKINGMSPAEVVAFIIAENIEFDQLINEFDQWTHVSFRKGNNRRQVLHFR
jgi:zinc D-Ala-D-Ala carboxypeptidase